MSTLLLLIELLCVGVVLVRAVCVAAKLNRRNWCGHPLQFIGIATSYTLLAGGALGILMRHPDAPWILLAGVALWIVFDKRRQSC